MDGYEPPCGYWDLNSGPLEEQSMLLMAESSPIVAPAIRKASAGLQVHG